MPPPGPCDARAAFADNRTALEIAARAMREIEACMQEKNSAEDTTPVYAGFCSWVKMSIRTSYPVRLNRESDFRRRGFHDAVFPAAPPDNPSTRRHSS